MRALAGPAIDIQAAGKRYGRQEVLHSMNLTLNEGESLALIGHNGAGKTTLLKLILGLTQPTTGSLRIWDLAPLEYKAHAEAGIGFLPEAIAFRGHLSGREILSFYAALKGARARQTDELLELVGLGADAKRRVGTYSKGMRQRLGLAQALLGRPRLLILDEPTSGLDPDFRRHFYELIDQQQSNGATIVLSSHALTEIEAQIDRIAILRHGRLRAHGRLDELRARSGLPVQVRIVMRSGSENVLVTALRDRYCYEQSAPGVFQILCDREEKTRLVHRLFEAAGEHIVDLDIMPPRLDDLFMHFNQDGPA